MVVSWLMFQLLFDDCWMVLAVKFLKFLPPIVLQHFCLSCNASPMNLPTAVFCVLRLVPSKEWQSGNLCTMTSE